jgi:hypothetical protein
MAKLPALPFVRSSVTQGLSANASYRQYSTLARDNGLQGMRRQDYLRVYSETLASRGNAARALTQPKDRPPTNDEIVNRSTVNARGYGQWVAIYQRTSGQDDFMHMPFLVKTREPITPAEAEARALDYLNQEPDAYDRVTIGVGYMGTEHFTPMER